MNIIELSWRNLVVLTSISLIITVLGFLTLPNNGLQIIGAVTNISTGTANVSIQSVTQIRMNNNTVDFGIGFINSSDTRCVLESNDTVRKNNTGGSTRHPCDKAGGGPGFNAPAITPNFAVENIGNVNITLKINSSFLNGSRCGDAACTVAGFLCNPTTTSQNCTQASPEYNWSAAEMESGACDSDAGLASRNRFNQSLVGAHQVVCSNFDFQASQNEIRLPLRIGIPRDSRQGLLTDTVSFIADTG